LSKNWLIWRFKSLPARDYIKHHPEKTRDLIADKAARDVKTYNLKYFGADPFDRAKNQHAFQKRSAADFSSLYSLLHLRLGYDAD